MNGLEPAVAANEPERALALAQPEDCLCAGSSLLAFLANVLDADRARTAFKFMWGVGVNEPYPVANLYPAVQSGDPDWRSYYTVNPEQLADG